MFRADCHLLPRYQCRQQVPPSPVRTLQNGIHMGGIVSVFSPISFNNESRNYWKSPATRSATRPKRYQPAWKILWVWGWVSGILSHYGCIEWVRLTGWDLVFIDQQVPCDLCPHIDFPACCQMKTHTCIAVLWFSPSFNISQIRSGCLPIANLLAQSSEALYSAARQLLDETVHGHPPRDLVGRGLCPFFKLHQREVKGRKAIMWAEVVSRGENMTSAFGRKMIRWEGIIKFGRMCGQRSNRLRSNFFFIAF